MSHTSTKITVRVEQFPDRRYATNPNGRGFINGTSVERGPILTNERTVSDAKAKFGEVVETMLDTWTSPKLICFDGIAGMCYQQPMLDTVAWAYQLRFSDGGQSSQVGYESMDKAVANCKHHMSQNATDYFDDESVMRGWRFLNPDQRDDHLLYAGFQRAYRHAHEVLGFSESQSHEWAGEFRNRGQFITDVQALADQASKEEAA